MIGRVICWFKKKHLRGKRVESLSNGAIKVFECPRCKRRTEYKA